MVDIAKTAHGLAVPATEEEIAREEGEFLLSSDNGLILLTDWWEELRPNVPEFGYTNPNLHRRIDEDVVVPPGSDYPFVVYDENGNPYKQTVVIGVWDGLNSYRTTTTYIHDEESTTCEIP